MTDASTAFIYRHLLFFIVFFVLTMTSVYVGDDDVAYKFMGRKPTGKEAIARIRFVMVRAIAAISGGVLMSAFIGMIVLKNGLLLALSQDQIVLLAVLCIVATDLLLGLAQNLLRITQRRQPTSITEFTIFKYNIGRFFGSRNRE